MRNQIFSLPPALLVLVSSAYAATAELWPYNLPRNEKYWPEHEAHVKRDAQIQERMAWQPPSGVQKMSGDPGEKFYLHYWRFEDAGAELESGEVANTLRRRAEATDFEQQYLNASLPENLLPPLLLHSDARDPKGSLRFLLRDLLEKRDFQCPSGTNSCANIDRPDSCCASGETCVIVTDTGLGDVGCCPSGSSCAGSVSTCNTDAGYTSCPDSENGGCCIPGYTCQDVGCIISGTSTTTTTLPTPTSTTSGRSSSAATSSTSSTTTTTPSSSSSSPSPTTTLPTSSQGELSCSTGFKTCPTSMGGGCCPTDRVCGSAECPASSTASSTAASSSASAVAPVRPTSGSDPSSVTTAPSTSTSQSINGCPTGFYACSAYYQGGCCRVGRDCQKTSCPAAATTALVSDGVTIGAQSGATWATESGACATGWVGCAASQGGGCCPSGYACGRSCTNTAAGTSAASTVGKEAASAGTTAGAWGWVWAAAGLGSGVAMVVL